MLRTSILLTPTLHQQLQLAAQQQSQSMSEFIRQALEKALEQKEDRQLSGMYKNLKKLRGIGTSTHTNASQSIDDILYGTNGSWSGSNET